MNPVKRTGLQHAKRRRAAARLRQLASLDATGPELAPVLLRELRDVLAFDSGGYFHPDVDGLLASYMETADAQQVMPLFFDHRMQRQVHELTRGYEEAAAHEHGPVTTLQLTKVPWARFERSDFFNLVLRPAGMLECVSLMPRLPDGNPVGALKMYRCTTTHPFAAEELDALAQLEPFLARALSPRGEGGPPEVHAIGTEMLVATFGGQVMWTTPRAQQWMAMAFGHRRGRATALPEAMQAVLQRLRWIQQGLSVEQPPELHVRTAHGQFTLRACVMTSADAGQDAVGVHITWQVSRPVRLLESIRTLRLPARQAEMGYLLACGLQEVEVARLTDVSLHTVVYHRRQLYARLQVANRRELVERLLT